MLSLASNWGYVIPGYLVVAATLAIYTMYVVVKGRNLARRLPASRRRFLD